MGCSGYCIRVSLRLRGKCWSGPVADGSYYVKFLCFIYLLFFPFHLWGLATLIGVGAVAMSLLGRPNDIITTGITTAVVMVVAAVSPNHAWKQPILRLVDTIVGVAVGVVGAWISLRSGQRRSATA
ncbi:MAG TPA: FUSC family protein [Edaphobacter sp.]|nr:FUSC family protein [Edaphobacter sp.]